MSSPRLLVAAAMAIACAAVPASASAALTPSNGATTPVPVGHGTYLDGEGIQRDKWTADGILGPSETVSLNFPLADDQLPLFGGGQGQLFRVGETDVSVDSTARTFPASSGGETMNTSPYTVTTGASLVCGTRIGVRLEIGAAGANLPYGIPTGVAGAFQRTKSFDYGNVLYEDAEKQAKVKVERGAALSKGIRIHLDSLEHQYSTYWVKLELQSPSGKTITLIENKGTTSQSAGSAATKRFTNVTFSDSAVNGVAPVSASAAADADFNGQVISPQDALSSFDGEPLSGDWKLIVTDKPAPLENRSGRGRALSGPEMIELGAWQIDTAGALCNGIPEAWFGSDPLYLSPDGQTIDGGASHDPSLGGSIASYEWDLDGNLGNGFETTTAGPTVSLPPTLLANQGERDIRLRVTDNEGNTSLPVTRRAIVTNLPVIAPGGVVVSPVTPIADQNVTLNASATDPDSPTEILTYAWDLNDDGDFTDKTGAEVVYNWDTSGVKVIRLKVTDTKGASTYHYQRLTVANSDPVARAKALTIPAIVGLPVTLTGVDSTDVDGTITKYSWDLNGDNEFDESEGSDPEVVTTFLEAGTAFVSLRVTDNTGGIDETLIEVQVTGLPVGVISASPSSPLVNENVSFSAAGSKDSDPSGSITKYEWDLDGNGSYELSGPAAVSGTRSYPNAGNVSVRLRLTDNDGATSVTSLNVLVRNPTQPNTNPTPNPNPTPTPAPGPVPIPMPAPGETVNVPGVGNVAAGIDPIDLPGGGFLGEDPPDGGVTLSGFAAKISAGSKQKGRKVYKKGMTVAINVNDKSSIVVKAMITVKDAKKLGLKIKKPTAIGSGKLALKKAGKGKFVVKFAKKYQRFVKKGNKTPVTLRGVVTSADGEKLAIARKVVVVK